MYAYCLHIAQVKVLFTALCADTHAHPYTVLMLFFFDLFEQTAKFRWRALDRTLSNRHAHSTSLTHTHTHTHTRRFSGYVYRWKYLINERMCANGKSAAIVFNEKYSHRFTLLSKHLCPAVNRWSALFRLTHHLILHSKCKISNFPTTILWGSILRMKVGDAKRVGIHTRHGGNLNGICWLNALICT